mmetsp:Transcript_17149/g.24584  ORF Transcript_17149/g.24584 Transcript_17149/m.24584 type:complete len:92 (+) Transcript_17149:353-628(+)
MLFCVSKATSSDGAYLPMNVALRIEAPERPSGNRHVHNRRLVRSRAFLGRILYVHQPRVLRLLTLRYFPMGTEVLAGFRNSTLNGHWMRML